MNQEKRFLCILVLAAALFANVGCTKSTDPAKQDLGEMTVTTEERAPTRREVQAAVRFEQATPTRVTTYSKFDTDEHSTIAGMDEIIDVAAKLGAPKLKISGAIVSQVGHAAWKLLEGNQARVSLAMDQLSIMPENTKDWGRMAGFKAPDVHAFKVRIKNGFGTEVVKYDYLVSYSYGGSVDGRGQYLSHLTVINSLVEVMWGFNLDAEFVTSDITNSGTIDKPIPAVSAEVRWKVKNIVTNIRKSNAFWVAGDGHFKALGDGDQEITSSRH